MATHDKTNETLIIPALALRDIVVFPHTSVPLFVGRDKSINALEYVADGENEILMVAQKDAAIDDPSFEDIYPIGTISKIVQIIKLPDGTVKILVEGVRRVRVLSLTEQSQYMEAQVQTLPEDDDLDMEQSSELSFLMTELNEKFSDYVRRSKKVSPDILSNLKNMEDPIAQVDTIASHLVVKLEQKQELLGETALLKRISLALALIEGELDILNVEQKIRGRVKRSMEKTQREYYLNEQLKAIQEELSGEDGEDEIASFENKINDNKGLSEEARSKGHGELKKLKSMNAMSAEAAVVRNYLEWLLETPWGKRSDSDIDLNRAQQVLDQDHYGLEKVKERILEFLAVQKRANKIRGPILCLVGPPGVGKTSLGSSIARAAGRKFVRMSLGGVRDEAEIRGHRRTYIGSMPGKIIQSLRKAKVSNPLFLLDEIDKMGQDFRGDPASALLEVLDPEQNSTFMDHYLEVEYDLSDVMFITTANSLDLPAPLLDRMEIIELSGYSEQEKIEIAKRHIVQKQVELTGLKSEECEISEDAIVDIVRYYTKESGVRSLERQIAKITRKSLMQILMNDTKKVQITKDNLSDYAGVRKYNFGVAAESDQIGVTTGLAWTQVGGEILSIEATELPGKGNMKVTGKLGEVMQESIQIARSYVHSKAEEFNIDTEKFEKSDIHLHVPAGATPKDGPSAGVAMVTSIVSVLTKKPVRKDVAMTGEVTLRGNVLPIGGLKEKLLAALRGGIKLVFIPKENEKDLQEIPQNVKDELQIMTVDNVDVVLKHALID